MRWLRKMVGRRSGLVPHNQLFDRASLYRYDEAAPVAQCPCSGRAYFTAASLCMLLSHRYVIRRIAVYM